MRVSQHVLPRAGRPFQQAAPPLLPLPVPPHPLLALTLGPGPLLHHKAPSSPLPCLPSALAPSLLPVASAPAPVLARVSPFLVHVHLHHPSVGITGHPPGEGDSGRGLRGYLQPSQCPLLPARSSAGQAELGPQTEGEGTVPGTSPHAPSCLPPGQSSGRVGREVCGERTRQGGRLGGLGLFGCEGPGLPSTCSPPPARAPCGRRPGLSSGRPLACPCPPPPPHPPTHRGLQGGPWGCRRKTQRGAEGARHLGLGLGTERWPRTPCQALSPSPGAGPEGPGPSMPCPPPPPPPPAGTHTVPSWRPPGLSFAGPSHCRGRHPRPGSRGWAGGSGLSATVPVWHLDE